MEERRRASDLCEMHSKQLHDLCITVYGNGDVESRENSLVGMVTKNGGVLRWLLGAVYALVGVLIIPSIWLIFMGGKIVGEIERQTTVLESQGIDLVNLKATSIGYRKAVEDGKLD